VRHHSSAQGCSKGQHPLWYLGIDWGTTGVSAVLMNSSTRCFYPLERLQTYFTQGGVSLKRCLDRGFLGTERASILEKMAGQLRRMVQEQAAYGQEVWSQLAGIVVGCPAHWSDTYRFNLREVMLRTGWVDQPHQILFLEEPIALVLSELRDMAQGGQWQGATLILDSGATTTEFALVDIPVKRSQLSYEHFHVASLAYGGDAIDQDIICQLLLSSQNLLLPLADEIEDGIQFPEVGKSDLPTRHRLSEVLSRAEWGEELLAIAREIKYRLQVETQIQVCFHQQHWTIHRRDLEMKVFVPFLRALNQEINRLFSQTGVARQGVRQALCTGRSASLEGIARWLRQKLPSAAIIQDRHSQGQRPRCSRVAYGLANLPLYPQVLNRVRHQYSDYFLLLELLRVMSNGAIAEGQIFQFLEKQGINTAVCGDRLRKLLQGELPPGLYPQWSHPLRTLEGNHNQHLFIFQQDTGLYTLNPEQKRSITDRLNQVLETSCQTLDDPYLLLW